MCEKSQFSLSGENALKCANLGFIASSFNNLSTTLLKIKGSIFPLVEYFNIYEHLYSETGSINP